jgi:anti-sigma factor RsiW
MSGCQSIGALLDGYHDGELGSLERWRVQRHLAGCAACRGELASLAQLGGLVRAAVGRAPEPDLWDAIAQRLPARRPERERLGAHRRAPSRRRWLPPLRVGAAAAACAVAFLVTTSDSGRLASIGGASGVVRSIYAKERPVMVLEPENSDDATIIWLMDEAGEQSPEVSQSVGV